MTGAEHYLEAERLLQLAREHQPGSKTPPPLVCREEALVHATLALAAATALPGLRAPDWAAWRGATGIKPEEAP